MDHSARQKFVRRAWEKAQVNEKWEQSSWAKKIEARQKVKTMFQLLGIIDIFDSRGFEIKLLYNTHTVSTIAFLFIFLQYNGFLGFLASIA